MNKIISWLLTLVMALGAVAPVAAREPMAAPAKTPVAKGLVKKFVTRAVTVEGVLTEIKQEASGTVLMVKVAAAWPKQAKKWAAVYPIKDKVIAVKLEGKSRLMRRHGHKSSVSEFTVGDTLRVVGKLYQDGSVTALNVKDWSIFVAERTGIIDGPDAISSTFLLRVIEQPWVVRTNSTTAFAVPGVEKAGLSDLKIGDTAVVRGLINTTSKTVTATAVKVTARAPIAEVAPATTTSATTTP